MGYRVEKISEKGLPDLKYIFNEAFKRERSLDFFKMKQNTNVFGASFLGYLAYDEESNEPAAFYGVYACLAVVRGEKYLVAQSGDTMTHPKHTRKGLFTTLALQTYEYCKEIGVHLVYGFPNQNSYPGFVKKLGWTHFDDLQAYHIRVKTLPWVRFKNIFRLSQLKHDRFCHNRLSKYKRGKPFPASCLEDGFPVIDHSKDFFDYKCYEKSHLIELSGVSVWVKPSDMFLQIGDIQRCSNDEFLSVVKELKKVAFCLGIPHLRFHCSTNTWLEFKLKKNAIKMANTYAVGGINFTNKLNLEDMKFTMADNDTF